jgi:hypothetical protein
MARKFGNGIDLAGQRAINFGDAVNPTDAVNLAQVQAFLRGLKWKDFARAASTGNVSVAAPGATIDGVTLSPGDRILLKNQTTGSENGIYVWNGAATPATRALDADAAAELVAATITVTEGNQVAAATPAGSLVFTQTVDNITLGTTALVWVPVGGSSSTYTNGLGLDLTGSSFSVKVGNGLLVDASGVKIDPSVVSRHYESTVGGSTSVTVTHGLGADARVVSVVDVATGVEEYPDVSYPTGSPNDATLTWAVAPAASSKRVKIVS